MIAIPLASFGQPAPQQEVKKGAIEGVVLVETTREPVRRVQVVAYPRRTSAGPGATMGQPQSFTATTDAEGKFTIADLEPGDYFLNIQKQGFSIARRSTFASSMQIKVGQGETVKGLRYALLPQAVIAGKVLDDEGEPVQGAQVQALAQQNMRGRKSWLPSAQGVQTNDRGEFRLANLVPGKVILQVTAGYQSMMAQEQARSGQPAMGYADTFYPGVTEPARAMQVELTAGAELTGYDVQLKRCRFTGSAARCWRRMARRPRNSTSPSRRERSRAEAWG
ncbi:MAG: carboxypeptidase regulatory-like domain-containing protein [Bryobacterales bacterium]|nr:carboxypeptidase regulatory-like domain-containing protein [Bryobacterales bacterium]